MPAKKILAMAVRVLVSVAMLGYLVVKIRDSEQSGHSGKSGNILPEWSSRTAAWLALALALTFLSVVVSAVRWRAVLQALDLPRRPPLRRLVSLYLASLFVGNVLPSTVGGDVLRVARLTRDTSEGPLSFASVILERLTGWLVLPALILSGFAINRGLLDLGRATRWALAIAVATLVLLVVVLALLSSSRVGGRLGRNEGWRRFAGAVHLGTAHLRRHRGAALTIVGWGFAYQLVLVAATFSAARTLGVDAIGLTVILTFFPAVLIAQVLPISISGLGVREALLVLFLKPLEVPEGKAVALGLLVYLMTLVVSLAGAPSFAFGKGSAREISAHDPVGEIESAS